jgi:hypothetical protein
VDTVYAALRTLHVLAFVFMSIPLFNLIVVNERAQLGSAFNYSVDRYEPTKHLSASAGSRIMHDGCRRCSAGK